MIETTSVRGMVTGTGNNHSVRETGRALHGKRTIPENGHPSPTFSAQKVLVQFAPICGLKSARGLYTGQRPIDYSVQPSRYYFYF